MVDFRKCTSIAVIAALLLSFSPGRSIAGASSKSEDEESNKGVTINQILAATCVGSGLTMIIVGSVMESETTHTFTYYDIHGNPRESSFKTGNDTTSLFVIGASMILLSTMFMVFPSDSKDTNLTAASGHDHNESRLPIETSVLVGGTSAVGLTWYF